MAKSLAVTVKKRKVAVVQTQVPAPSPTHGVAKRVKLWEGGTFQVKVPADAKLLDGKNIGKEYLQFYRPVARGKVNVFVHGKNPSQFLGAETLCRAEIWEKTYKDGRRYRYVDFYVLGFHDSDPPATHDWRVIQGKDAIIPKAMRAMKNIEHFPTPAPLEGFVIIGEH